MNKKLVAIFTKAMKKETEKNVNSACFFFCYQPKESKAIEKLKKRRSY